MEKIYSKINVKFCLKSGVPKSGLSYYGTSLEHIQKYIDFHKKQATDRGMMIRVSCWE